MSSGDHKWIRGNHDNPTLCRTLVDRGYAGDYGYDEVNGFFWLGGAYSIDWRWRVPGISWWPDEELSYTHLGTAISRFERFKPVVVASHDAPASIRDHLLGIVSAQHACGIDKLRSFDNRTSSALDQMFHLWQPKHWVFGHYHVSTTFNFRGTQFTCVPELGTHDVEW